MSPEVFVGIFREALFTIMLIVAAIVVPSLIVGLMVAVFQAATSINEQTLSFLPRLMMTLLTLIVGAHWFTQTMMDFMLNIFEAIPMVIG
ncbi:MAG: flagellar biosynthesis protein FliQ [Gammaproteobacteria bacterium]|nr:flagellar biosynthesis protein FliQ [Gammaproteobacteria bacterium]